SALWDQVANHLRDLPGVQAVAYADWPILDGRSFKSDAISINGRPSSDTAAWFVTLSPGWLATMWLPLLAPRDAHGPHLTTRTPSSPRTRRQTRILRPTFLRARGHSRQVVRRNVRPDERSEVPVRRRRLKCPLSLSPPARSAGRLYAVSQDRRKRHHAGRHP